MSTTQLQSALPSAASVHRSRLVIAGRVITGLALALFARIR